MATIAQTDEARRFYTGPPVMRISHTGSVVRTIYFDEHDNQPHVTSYQWEPLVMAPTHMADSGKLYTHYDNAATLVASMTFEIWKPEFCRYYGDEVVGGHSPNARLSFNEHDWRWLQTTKQLSWDIEWYPHREKMEATVSDDWKVVLDGPHLTQAKATGRVLWNCRMSVRGTRPVTSIPDWL